MKPLRKRSVAPGPGAGASYEMMDLGEPIYSKALVPTQDELQALPAAARTAIVERYERAAGTPRPELPAAERVRAAAFTIVADATVGSPIERALCRLRREFDWLAFKANELRWTDDTPIPPNMFG